jgi:hypothetical protein
MAAKEITAMRPGFQGIGTSFAFDDGSHFGQRQMHF